MKYFFCWIAIFAFFIAGIPMFTAFKYNNDISFSNEQKKGEEIDVYFVSEDKVKTMNSEEYILGVLMAEMPAEFELEALKAQCVAARTYLYEKISSDSNNTAHKGGVVCTDSTHCQAYINENDAKNKWGKNASKYLKKCKNAVNATKGVIAQYDNKPIKAVFHAYASGKTENAKDVWGSEVEYLKSVESPGDLTAPKFFSEVVVSVEEFRQKMNVEYGCNFENGLIGDITYTAGGAVDQITVGSKKIAGKDVRKTFNLKSACFSVNVKEDSIVFNVKGYGHGVGMSQYGANYYAKEGLKYDEILKKYYSGIELVDKKLPSY